MHDRSRIDSLSGGIWHIVGDSVLDLPSSASKLHEIRREKVPSRLCQCRHLVQKTRVVTN